MCRWCWAPPVRRIRWDGPGVEVETARGTIRARATIVTVSTGVLAFEDIAFTPDLPDRHLEAIFDLPMGLLTKVPVRIAGTRLGLQPFDDLLIERHARHDLYFLAFPFDLDLMVGFVGGDFAWEMEAAGPCGGGGFRHRPAGGPLRVQGAPRRHPWHHDQLVGRAARPGRLRRRASRQGPCPRGAVRPGGRPHLVRGRGAGRGPQADRRRGAAVG